MNVGKRIFIKGRPHPSRRRDSLSAYTPANDRWLHIEAPLLSTHFYVTIGNKIGEKRGALVDFDTLFETLEKLVEQANG